MGLKFKFICNIIVLMSLIMKVVIVLLLTCLKTKGRIINLPYRRCSCALICFGSDG